MMFFHSSNVGNRQVSPGSWQALLASPSYTNGHIHYRGIYRFVDYKKRESESPDFIHSLTSNIITDLIPILSTSISEICLLFKIEQAGRFNIMAMNTIFFIMDYFLSL